MQIKCQIKITYFAVIFFVIKSTAASINRREKIDFPSVKTFVEKIKLLIVNENVTDICVFTSDRASDGASNTSNHTSDHASDQTFYRELTALDVPFSIRKTRPDSTRSHRVVEKKPHAYLLVAVNLSDMFALISNSYARSNWNNAALFIIVILRDHHVNYNEFVRELTNIFVRKIVIFTLDTLVTARTIANCARTVEIEAIVRGRTIDVVDFEANYRACQFEIRGHLNMPYASVTRKGHVKGISVEYMKILSEKVGLNVSWAPTGVCTFCGMGINQAFVAREPGCANMRSVVGFPAVNVLFCTRQLWLEQGPRDLAYTIQDSNLLVVTKRYGVIFTWKIVLQTLSKEFWAFHWISYTAATVAWTLSIFFNKFKAKKLDRVIVNKIINTVVLGLFSLSLGIPTPFHSTYLTCRLILICWLIYTIHFTALFQSRYTELLSTPERVPQLLAVAADVFDSDLPIYRPFVFPRNFGFPIEIWNRSIVFNATWESIQEILKTHPDGAIILQERYFFMYNTRLFFDAENLHTLVHMNENLNLFKGFKSFRLLTKDHIFRDAFNNIIYEMHGNGMFKKINNGVLKKGSRFLNTIENSRKKRPISMKQIKCPLYILLGGSFIGFWVAIVEWWKKRKKINNMQNRC